MLMDTHDLSVFNPVGIVLRFLSLYGWFVTVAFAFGVYINLRVRPILREMHEERQEAARHKDVEVDPDKALDRMEAMQRARAKQQQLLKEASEKALEQQKEREERKQRENAERLQKYGNGAGQKLGSEEDYLPLSGGASTSSYRPPKRSKCGGGGCGK